MKLRCSERASGKDEAGQRRQFGLYRIDGLLQLVDSTSIDARKSIGAWRGELRSDFEEIGLNRSELHVDWRGGPGGPGKSDERIQFVDSAIGFDAGIVFRDPVTAE